MTLTKRHWMIIAVVVMIIVILYFAIKTKKISESNYSASKCPPGSVRNSITGMCERLSSKGDRYLISHGFCPPGQQKDAHGQCIETYLPKGDRSMAANIKCGAGQVYVPGKGCMTFPSDAMIASGKRG